MLEKGDSRPDGIHDASDVMPFVITNGITSEAYWYNSEGERYPNVGYRTHVQSKGWERTLTLNGRTSGTVGAGKRLEAIQIIVEPGYGVG